MDQWRLIKFLLLQFAVLCILAVHPVMVWSQQFGSASVAEVLTLDRAVMLALQNNRQVKNAALEVGKSQASPTCNISSARRHGPYQ
jgi:hypothetical protein